MMMKNEREKQKLAWKQSAATSVVATSAVKFPATSVVASLPAPAVVQTGEDTMLPREDSSNSNISSKLEVSCISHSLNKLSILIFLVGDEHDYLGSWKTST
jgi:hypothetical protein